VTRQVTQGSPGGAEELSQECRELTRAFEAHRMATASDDREARVVAYCRDARASKCAEFFVVLPCDDQDRHLEACKLFPKGQLRAGACCSKRRGQARRCVAKARGPVSLLAAQVSKKGSCEPIVDEFWDIRVPTTLEAGRENLVVMATSLSLGLVTDARMGSDDDEAFYQRRHFEGHVQHAPAAEGVPDIVGFGTGGRYGAGGLTKPSAVSRHRRAAVARQVKGYDFVVGFEIAGDPCPRGTRLGEAVGEHDTWSMSTAGRMKCNCVHVRWPVREHLR